MYIQTIQGDIDETHYIDFKSQLPTEKAIPRAIAVYLSALGPVTDPNGRKWHINVPNISEEEHNGIPGFFGLVNGDTHHLYGSTPSPGVAVYSVLYEIANPQGVVNWDLPVGVRPLQAPGEEVISPTRALLCYRPKTAALSQELRNVYAEFELAAAYNAENQDLEGIVFGRSHSGIKIARDLLSYVSGKIAQSKIPLVTGSIETQVGSQTQLGFVLANDNGRPINVRPTQGIVHPLSYTQLISLRASAVAVLKLRVKYSDIPGNYIYRFQAAVPQEWRNTINADYMVAPSG